MVEVQKKALWGFMVFLNSTIEELNGDITNKEIKILHEEIVTLVKTRPIDGWYLRFKILKLIRHLRPELEEHEKFEKVTEFNFYYEKLSGFEIAYVVQQLLLRRGLSESIFDLKVFLTVDGKEDIIISSIVLKEFLAAIDLELDQIGFHNLMNKKLTELVKETREISRDRFGVQHSLILHFVLKLVHDFAVELLLKNRQRSAGDLISEYVNLLRPNIDKLPLIIDVKPSKKVRLTTGLHRNPSKVIPYHHDASTRSFIVGARSRISALKRKYGTLQLNSLTGTIGTKSLKKQFPRTIGELEKFNKNYSDIKEPKFHDGLEN